jgi:hypothetical protein
MQVRVWCIRYAPAISAVLLLRIGEFGKMPQKPSRILANFNPPMYMDGDMRF